MTLREQLAACTNRPEKVAMALAMAGRKPWTDRPDPWGSDSDGEDNGAFDTDPGDERPTAPEPNPDTEGSGDMDMRATLMDAAAVQKDPEVARALLAIEARLGEISLFLKTAMSGTSGKTLLKLSVLAHII